ncbi:unnamed protein product [Chrysodeixis includens]|uniref:DNA topoisomerase I n=1 Tax=Chrysodeixis includens TaxID=689277 RepID=A0A9P0FUL7_CHRIL|nr:unnamed protein product [Chrysodeixis includens]
MNMSEKEVTCDEPDQVDVFGTISHSITSRDVLQDIKSDQTDDDDEDGVSIKRSKLETNTISNKHVDLVSAEKSDDNVIMKTNKKSEWEILEHQGPIFPAEYTPLPDNVQFIYDKQKIKLSPAAEEVAGFYAKMLDHKYTENKIFNENFFTDWRDIMEEEEKNLIKDIAKCDFSQIKDYFELLSENKKKQTTEEKKMLQSERKKIKNKYGYCIVDGNREKICNYIIEAPGLFKGRGDHPKMGKLKTRVMPEEITINCSRGSVVPKPPAGHQWGNIIHDNSAFWLASWVGKVSGKKKYVELDPSSTLKQEKDKQKYDTAKRLHKYIDEIRKSYTEHSMNNMSILERQRTVALYFIDKLALRAGNEKDDDLADTVGCCSLRVEHVELYDIKDNKENVVEFDFLGKDSMPYYISVPVEPHIFKNLVEFKKNKKDTEDLFDDLDTKSLNEYLKTLMPELTAKVFRTYNASRTLQMKLDAFNKADATIDEKVQHYNQANREVATLCNHQRTARVPTSARAEKLEKEIKQARLKVDIAETEDSRESARRELIKLENRLDQTLNKQVALNTSREHYMDPRITVAWCLKHDVPLHRVYSERLLSKFQWAIKLADKDFVFG